MNRNLLTFLLLIATIVWSTDSYAQKKNKTDVDTLLNSSVVSGLKFRSVGPAFASGRVADFAVNPNNFSEWYIAFASSGIWKTVNNGQTFSPVFDNYGSYSIGCLAIDPTNPNVIWTGTGENNHQRAIGYGDGVYKSVDGGKSWENKGLKDSRQIGMIAINPENPNIVFVAAEGSIWGPGGERGLYKTTDGGENWKLVLEISENTGVNNVVIDPKNPNIMYATSEQRRRHVYTKIGGGPESRFYKSTDGGETWLKIESGLPSGDVGGMGIAVSPVNTDVVYLIIEAQEDAGGFYRSSDRGESWSRMSDYTASGQYYNEIYCDPNDVNKVYSVETFSKVTLDGGKTWKNVSVSERHVDDHALWINPTNSDHFIIGGDGGAYITYDGGANYSHVGNIASTQYYRVAVDNEKPFYNIYGGTQDNNTHGGPSQTLNEGGIPNQDWIVTVGGDGFWAAIDPTDPNIVYSEYQYGNVCKYDKKTGERIYLKPYPAKEELTYRWNWDAPFLISPHKHDRLYMAANKVFMSNDGGLSWKTISDDLTAQVDRHSFKVMGKYWSSDAVQKDVSTSQYGTIVSMSVSPVKNGLVYIGTDDGVIQVCENTQAENPVWHKIDKFPGVPQYTYVSDVFASETDENVVFASFNNIKSDDLKPYIMRSDDKGKTWTMITKGLPKNGPVYTVAQDYKNKNLLFCGTEFGFYTSVDGGKNWIKFSAGLPTIQVRDIAIQKDEDDLAIATFGRSFYVLDDYSSMRLVSEEMLKNEAVLFDINDAKIYMQTDKLYGQGADYYYGKNPEFGAVFTYYLKEVPKTQKEIRQEKEKEQFEKGEYIKQLSWREAEEENLEIAPYLVFTITDENKNVIRELTADAGSGINRVYWDFTYPVIFPTDEVTEFNPTKNSSHKLLKIVPGKYFVKMGIVVRNEYKDLTDYKEFEAKPLTNLNLTDAERKEYFAFQQELAEVMRVVWGTIYYYDQLTTKIVTLKQIAINTPKLSDETLELINKTEQELHELKYVLYGNDAKASWEEVPPQIMPIDERIGAILYAHWEATHTVTQTEKDNLEIVKEDFDPVYVKIKEIGEVTIPKIEAAMEDAKAPVTPGRLPEWK
ncbi:MAG: hypothetical protein JXL97_15830 [Bacteroidales bacterium]|nr:hypothetical protein [Bacteroidales bacterium]